MKHFDHQALNCVILLDLHSPVRQVLPLWVKNKIYNEREVGKRTRVEGLYQEESGEEVFLAALGKIGQTPARFPAHQRSSPLRMSAPSTPTATFVRILTYRW